MQQLEGQLPLIQPGQAKYCLYARNSTEAEERQALSIDSQIKEMMQIAEREQLDVVEVRKESHSAKESGTRLVFQTILEDVEQGHFNAILTWAPDRLSRNAGDLGKLVDLIDQKKLLTIKTFGQTFNDSPSDKFLLMILCSQAKLENDNKSINVKRGLRTRCEQGLWPARTPTGYRKKNDRNAKCELELDPERAMVIRQIFEKVAYEKWSGRKVHAWLKYDLNFKTENNKHLSTGNLFKILSNTFYYGRFEFPKGGGVNRHVYYRCCKSKDKFCRNKAINETDLIKSFHKIADDLDLDEVQLTEKLNQEIQKFKRLQAMFLGKDKSDDIEKVDLRDYMKFVLTEGAILEKRTILDAIKNKIILENKIVFIR